MANPERKPIEIGSGSALVYKVQNLVDGGARVTLDFDQTASALAVKLLENKLKGKSSVSVGFVEMPEDTDFNDIDAMLARL